MRSSNQYIFNQMARVNPTCSICRHIIFPNEQHTCPSPDYIMARDLLFQDALDAEDMFDLDKLEAYANRVRQ